MLTKYEFYPLILAVGILLGMLLVKVADTRDFKTQYGFYPNTIVKYKCTAGVVVRTKMSDMLKALEVVVE